MMPTRNYRMAPGARRRLGAIALTLVTHSIALFYFLPIAWMILSAFKSEKDAVTLPPLWVFTPTWENIERAMETYLPSLGTTLVIVSGATLLSLILGLPAAYAFAMQGLKRRRGTMIWILSTRMMPPAGIAIPLFLMLRDVGLLDTKTGLIVIYGAINLSLVIWMMATYFDELPREIFEAGRLDGMGPLRSFLLLALPLVLPGMISTALLTVILVWNEFLLALILTSVDVISLSVFIASFKSAMGLFVAQMSAASVLTIAPIMILGWIAQRGLIRGMTLGAVK